MIIIIYIIYYDNMDNCIVMFDESPIGDSIFVGKEFKGQKKLTLKLGNKNNKVVKKALKDCYDNTIIIDNRSEYLLVIDQMPLYKYFRAIENDNLQWYDDIQIIHWTSKKLQKYINKSITRKKWDKLETLNDVYNLNLFKQNKSEEIEMIENEDVSYEKAPQYMNYLYNKRM